MRVAREQDREQRGRGCTKALWTNASSARRRDRRGLSLALMLLLPLLNGCLWHTHKVAQAKMLENVQSAPPEQLVEKINNQYDAINTMSATVTFTATEGGSLKGKETTYTSFSGYILMRKPDALRVIGFLPVVHTRA